MYRCVQNGRIYNNILIMIYDNLLMSYDMLFLHVEGRIYVSYKNKNLD